jgi:hypothetical protein
MNDDIPLMSLIFISLMVPFTIGYIMISYIKSLESKNCVCSEDTRRKYVKYYGYTFIIAALLGIITLIIYIKYPPIRKLRNFIKCVILIIHFLAAYVIFTYSKLLEENNCQCAHSWKRVFLKYYGYLLTGFLGFLFLSLLIALLLIVSSGESKYILELQRLLVGCVTQ